MGLYGDYESAILHLTILRSKSYVRQTQPRFIFTKILPTGA